MCLFFIRKHKQTFCCLLRIVLKAKASVSLTWFPTSGFGRRWSIKYVYLFAYFFIIGQKAHSKCLNSDQQSLREAVALVWASRRKNILILSLKVHVLIERLTGCLGSLLKPVERCLERGKQTRSYWPLFCFLTHRFVSFFTVVKPAQARLMVFLLNFLFSKERF